MLVDSHEGAEERRFARVRIADQRDRQRCFLDGGRHFFNRKASIAQWDRHDGYAQSIVGPKTNLVACHANNAGIPRPEHLDAGSTAQAELLQAVNVVSRSENAADPRLLAGSQLIERNWAIVHVGFERSRQKGAYLLSSAERAGPVIPAKKLFENNF
jgi:hypothetical protein